MLTIDGFRIAHRIAIAGFVAATIAAAGCSFSYSSESSSDSSKSSSESSGSSSESSSGSSSKDDSNEASYEQDVADYTSAYVISGGSSEGFLNGIGDLAAKSGISDWESSQTTWRGIGRGLAAANVKKDQVAVYQKNWTNGNTVAMSAIQQGYGQKR